MSIAALPAAPRARELPYVVAHAAGAWPRTTRVMPWLLAGFITMLFLLPFDAIDLPIPVPIDPKLDRVALAGLGGLWLLAMISRGRERGTYARNFMDLAIAGFVLAVVASVLLNVERIALADELQLAIKKVALLLAYLAFFYIVATTIRREELRNFGLLIVGLGVVLGLGIVWEYRMRDNLFFEWTRKILPSGFELSGELSDPRFGRPSVTGPTLHGLAATAMLAMALPFAIVEILADGTRRRKIIFAVAAAIMLAGAVSTLRKTAIIAPVSACLTMLLLRPREMVRLLPLGVVLLVLIQAMSPGALGSLRSQLSPSKLQGAGTVQGRVDDFDAVRPDLWAHPVIGRGYGTYDHNKYRLLDNQYLGIKIQTGFVGLGGFFALILGAIGLSARVARGRDPALAPIGLAAAGAATSFAISCALFDIMAFPQAPYIWLLCAGMAVAALAALGRAEPATGRRAA